AGEGSAAFHIKQGHVVRHADPAGDGYKPVLSGPARVHSIGAKIFVLQIAPGAVGLDAGDQLADLIIEPGLAADANGIARSVVAPVASVQSRYENPAPR